MSELTLFLIRVAFLAILWIFVLGTVLMRSAGCALNDFADTFTDSPDSTLLRRSIWNSAASATSV